MIDAFFTAAAFDTHMQRTHYIDPSVLNDMVGQRVTLCGWVENVRELHRDRLLFIKMRDIRGSVQIVFDADNNPSIIAPGSNVLQAARETTVESVISVSGTLRHRPPEMVNKAMETGSIELVVERYSLLSRAQQLPFQFINAEENVRLLHRYLDLRRPQLQRRLMMRSDALSAVKGYFHGRGFLEVETPTLFKSTPEGAREFLVATRHRGKFYALTQSPQQYKQLLMMGGLDRYFQIARCYRDESGRLDRQPEFTQIDVEMSFITQEDIYSLIEGLLGELWRRVLGVDIGAPFQRMPYGQVMERYGVDKPDLRLGMEIENVKDVFVDCKSDILRNLALSDSGHIFAFNARGLGSHASRKQMNDMQEEAKRAGAQGLITIKVHSGQKFSGPISEHLSPEEQKLLCDRLQLQDGDLLIICGGNDWENTLTPLGRVRILCGSLLQQHGILNLDPRDFRFLWVTDFPLFERSEEGQAGLFEGAGETALASMHHPFTAPHPDDMERLHTDPLSVRGQHYDIVLNGFEIGGGSIRIHDAQLQQHILQNMLRLGPERTKERFSHLLEAMSYGCPPHGGIALGFDRLMILLCQAVERSSQQLSLRDVIAFPKTATGNELMSNSPSTVEDALLKELHIQIKDE